MWLFIDPFARHKRDAEEATEEVLWNGHTKQHEPVAVLRSASKEKAHIGVVREHGKLPYLRTYADGKWNDTVLAQAE